MNALITGVAAAGAAASIAYSGFSTWAGAQFVLRRRRPSADANHLPPVSILKPLKGTDPEMYQSLRSHCVQSYPEYEILFGITDPNDPAAAMVQRLIREFPDRALRLVQCDKKLGANGKASSLAQMAAIAQHDVLLVNDSDIRVEPDYLRTVTKELTAPGVGLVTCLYRGVPAHTIASKLEALAIATDFMAGVLAAERLEGGLRFGLGSTLALRRSDLEAIGGFEAIADYLADDYQLGWRIAERNLKVKLSDSVVETYLPAYDLSGFFSHQLRWARTIRTSRPGGYGGLLLTFTLPWAILTLTLMRGATWGWVLFAAALLVRSSMALVIGKLVLRDRAVLHLFWLIPVRDVIAVVVWLGGLAGRKIIWRGETFYLKDGKLERAD
jgi:ceramide glucosyltransferase